MNIPEGYERVPYEADKVIQKDWLCVDRYGSWVTGSAGSTMANQNGVVYARPITKPKAVKCPNCGKNMDTEGGLVSCESPECPLVGGWFKPSFIKRITIAPEPLTCPRCGGDVTIIQTWMDGIQGKGACCVKCGLMSPFSLTAAEAESEFRKLRYVKEGA